MNTHIDARVRELFQQLPVLIGFSLDRDSVRPQMESTRAASLRRSNRFPTERRRFANDSDAAPLYAAQPWLPLRCADEVH
jgi:hypothetical protein